LLRHFTEEEEEEEEEEEAAAVAVADVVVAAAVVAAAVDAAGVAGVRCCSGVRRDRGLPDQQEGRSLDAHGNEQLAEL
jgi:hypothetical protein